MVVNIKDFLESTLNNTLANNYLRMFIMLICSVFIGYTLQPVPKWLSNLFDNSNLFKFVVLVAAGITAVYPLDGDELACIVIGAVVILMLFSLFRRVNEDKNGQES